MAHLDSLICLFICHECYLGRFDRFKGVLVSEPETATIFKKTTLLEWVEIPRWGGGEGAPFFCLYGDALVDRIFGLSVLNTVYHNKPSESNGHTT